MGEIEVPNNKAITSLPELRARLGGLKENALSPEDKRTVVLANSLEQLADLNNNIRKDRDPDMIAANPPTYELLSSTTS